MKFSEAMLKGFQRVSGNQRTKLFSCGPGECPSAVCALGAVNLGRNGNAEEPRGLWEDVERFSVEWGERPEVLNDLGMEWEHIYGMAVAAGL